jgi:hypothetical protein
MTVSNKDKKLSYVGWGGNNNVGDDAIFLGTKQLFADFELIDVDEDVNPEATIYGGGTLMPPKPPEADQIRDTYSAAIGVGVKEPEFRNQKFAPVDLGYYFGIVGQRELLRNKFVKYALRPLEFLSDSVVIQTDHIYDHQFDIMRDFDRLGVRGPVAEEILGRYNVDCKVVGDTALILEPTEYHREETKKIGLTLRDGGYKWSDDDQYLDIVIDALESLPSEYEFVLIPFAPEDIGLHLELEKQLPNAIYKDYCSYQTDVQGILDEYAECDVIIGEKLHASVLAACTYTPFISLEYQRKNEGFAKSVNMADYNIRVDNLTDEWMDEQLDQLINSNDVTKELEAAVSQKRKLLIDFTEKCELLFYVL